VLGETLLEKCVRQHPQSVTLLQEQYRMHEMIMNFSSKEFYESKLQAHPGVARHLVLDGDQPVVFVDTAGCGFEEVVEGSGIANPEESGLLLKHLELFISEVTSSYNTENFPSIAVISPYRHQVERLKEDIRGIAALQPLLHSISVNTIDSFQGQERDVVYISMVRSNTDNSIGFLSDIRRMNVAMTRARKKLVVIGDSATLSQFPFYADFIQYAQEKNGYVSAWEFMM
jgi:superfamily I DNA and/or RNA helicase